jgi:hypothetical protein
MVVYAPDNTNTLKAMADNQIHRTVLGFVLDTSVAPGVTYTVQTGGIISLPTTTWDALTGDTGGLIVRASYFLSTTTAGSISTTPPSPSTSNFLCIVGQAVNSTDLIIRIEQYVDSPQRVEQTGTTGAQTITAPFPMIPTSARIYINGLPQSPSAFSISGQVVTLPVGLNIIAGDLLTLEYLAT